MIFINRCAVGRRSRILGSRSAVATLAMSSASPTSSPGPSYMYIYIYIYRERERERERESGNRRLIAMNRSRLSDPPILDDGSIRYRSGIETQATAAPCVRARVHAAVPLGSERRSADGDRNAELSNAINLSTPCGAASDPCGAAGVGAQIGPLQRTGQRRACRPGCDRPLCGQSRGSTLPGQPDRRPALAAVDRPSSQCGSPAAEERGQRAVRGSRGCRLSSLRQKRRGRRSKFMDALPCA
jgi:hypothetical protein